MEGFIEACVYGVIILFIITMGGRALIKACAEACVIMSLGALYKIKVRPLQQYQHHDLDYNLIDGMS